MGVSPANQLQSPAISVPIAGTPIDWSPATFNGLIIGKSSRHELTRELATPSEGEIEFVESDRIAGRLINLYLDYFRITFRTQVLISCPHDEELSSLRDREFGLLSGFSGCHKTPPQLKRKLPLIHAVLLSRNLVSKNYYLLTGIPTYATRVREKLSIEHIVSLSDGFHGRWQTHA